MAASAAVAPPIPFDQLTFIEAKEELPAAAAAGSAAKQIIDVRSPEEFAAGHIKGSVNVPLPRIQDPAEIDKVIEELKTNYKQGVVVTCFQSLKRGPTAASHIVSRLQEAGIELDVCVLKGGVENVQQTPELAQFVHGNAAAPH